MVFVASKFNRSLVWGTRTNSACKRSAGATPIFGSYSRTPTTVSQSRGILSHPSVCIRLSKHIVNKLLIVSNSRDILSHPSTRPLFGGFHCFGYSSDKRLWLPPPGPSPGLGLADSLPLVVEFSLRFPCCAISGSRHLRWWSLLLQNSTAASYGARAPTRLASGLAGATPIFGSYSWTPTTASQSRGILSHPPGSDSRSPSPRPRWQRPSSPRPAS